MAQDENLQTLEYVTPVSRPPTRICKTALVALALSILGVPCFGGMSFTPIMQPLDTYSTTGRVCIQLTAIPAVSLLLGIVALRRIERSGGRLWGAMAAIPAIVFSVCWVLLGLFAGILIANTRWGPGD